MKHTRLAVATAALVLPLAAQVPDAPVAGAPDPVSAVFRERAARRAAFRNDKVLTAIRGGLGWLLTHQDHDGHWDADGFMKHDAEGAKSDGPGNGAQDLGVTALALLALLAQADTVHLDSCHLAADWLTSALDLKSGRVRTPSPDFIYAQALATLALTEAAALLGRERHRDAAELGLHYLETHRNRGAAWRYQLGDGDNDTSITAWCLAAYAAGFHIGLDVSTVSIGEALAWLDSVTDPSGRTGYSKIGECSARKPGDHGTRFPADRGEAMTASALHARLLCGMSPGNDLARSAAALVLTKPPTAVPAAIDFYYWLHASLAMAHLQGTPEQRRWEQPLFKILLASQAKDGGSKGSWDPIDVWGGDGGRVYSTAAVVLCLSSSYRMGDTDALAQIPDTVPFRKVHGLWKKGAIGAAAAALAEIPAEAATGDAARIKMRIEWYVAVEVAHATRVLATLEAVRPDVLDRHQVLEDMVALLSPLPVAEAATERLEFMRKDPLVRNEIQAAKELRSMQKVYDAALATKNPRQRQQAREQLQKFAAKYANTKAAEQARTMSERLQ